MARAKSKSKSTAAMELPRGFKAISGGNSWKGDKPGDCLTGRLLRVESVTFQKRGKDPARTVPCYFIECADGTHKVFQSAGLKALANVKKGQRVYIGYMGQKVITRGHNPMREYTVAVA